MRAAQALRLIHIDAFVEWQHEPLRRRNLMAAWGISAPQASIDLAMFRRAFPHRLAYCLSEKGYRACAGTKPVFAIEDHQRALGAHIASQNAIKLIEALP